MATYDCRIIGNYGTFYLVSTGADRGKYIYVPDSPKINTLKLGQAPSETFILGVSDTNGQTLEQTVVISITGANDRPVLDLQPADNTTIDRSLSFTLGDSAVAFSSSGTNLSDPDSGTSLASLAVSYPKTDILNGSNETIVISGKSTITISLSEDSVNGSFTLVIDGIDTNFTYVVSSTTDVRTITITLASGTAMSLVQGEAVIDALAYRNTVSSGISSGTREFSFTVNDGSTSNSPLAVATVLIGPAENSQPTVSAGSPSATLVEAGGVANGTPGTASATITLSKSDVDGTASYDTAWLAANGWSTSDLGATYTKAGTYGTATLTLATGVVSYVLDNTATATEALVANQSVTDSFVVQVTDGTATASTTASFAITGANDATVLAVDSAEGLEDTTLSVAAAAGVLANDSDLDDTLTVTSFTVAGDSTVYSAGQSATITGQGSLTLNSDGSYSFVPEENWSGSVPQVTYTVSTGGTSTLDITIAARERPTHKFTVEPVTVNEASPYVVFRVQATNGDLVALSLFDGDGADGSTQARLGEDYGLANATDQSGWMMQYFNGVKWADYQPGSTVRVPDAGALLLVRVPIINDVIFEGPQCFVLEATTQRGGSTIFARGSATIGDSAQGAVFNESGAENRAVPKDDDRSIRVSIPIVNEGSPYAVFTIAAPPGAVELSLRAADGEGRASIPLLIGGRPNIEYWNGLAWTIYDGASAVVPDSGVLLVRVAIDAEQDALREGTETFSLWVQRGDVLSEGRAEIRDDGTGVSYPGEVRDGLAVISTSVRDDDFDRDGIAPTVEEMLATLAASQGFGNIGDINGDGVQDSEQNALATLAWITADKFKAGNEGTLSEIKPIIAISVTASSIGDDTAAIDITSQLTDIEVLAYDSGLTGGGLPTPAGTTGDGAIIDVSWDPIRFTVEPQNANEQLRDQDLGRAGTQIRVYIDISLTGVTEGSFNTYLKYVSSEALAAALDAGGLRGLDGDLITKAGWYDFTRRQDASGNYIGDGARFVVRDGMIVGIELIFSDNAFGDNDPAFNRINDPGVPVHVTAPLARPVSPPPVFEQDRLRAPTRSGAAWQPMSDMGVYQPLRFDSALTPLLAADVAPGRNITEPLFAGMPQYYEAEVLVDKTSDTWKVAVIPAAMPELSVFRGIDPS